MNLIDTLRKIRNYLTTGEGIIFYNYYGYGSKIIITDIKYYIRDEFKEASTTLNNILVEARNMEDGTISFDEFYSAYPEVCQNLINIDVKYSNLKEFIGDFFSKILVIQDGSLYKIGGERTDKPTAPVTFDTLGTTSLYGYFENWLMKNSDMFKDFHELKHILQSKIHAMEGNKQDIIINTLNELRTDIDLILTALGINKDLLLVKRLIAQGGELTDEELLYVKQTILNIEPDDLWGKPRNKQSYNEVESIFELFNITLEPYTGRVASSLKNVEVAFEQLQNVIIGESYHNNETDSNNDDYVDFLD